MNMSIAHSGNASCHKIPDSYATIVAAYSQQCATSVECTRESLTARIQDTIIVLPTVVEQKTSMDERTCTCVCVHVCTVVSLFYLAHLWITLIHRLCN